MIEDQMQALANKKPPGNTFGKITVSLRINNKNHKTGVESIVSRSIVPLHIIAGFLRVGKTTAAEIHSFTILWIASAIPHILSGNRARNDGRILHCFTFGGCVKACILY